MNNIRLGNPDASDEDVYWAARQVKLHDYIQSLPDGYHTSVQETGIRFSGGERQRIALARILPQDAPIVVLDEPTVGLDPKTEKELLSTMFQVLDGKTVLWITHHLAGAEAADRILFLDKGKLAMAGSHQQPFGKQSALFKTLSSGCACQPAFLVENAKHSFKL